MADLEHGRTGGGRRKSAATRNGARFDGLSQRRTRCAYRRTNAVRTAAHPVAMAAPRTHSTGSRRYGHLPVALVLALALTVPAFAQPVGTQLSIRITPRAAALISALQHGLSPAQALASLPAADSRQAFAQSCDAAGGNALITDQPALHQRVCL